MQQKVIIVTPIVLFETLNKQTIERGNCACAIVALPADRPKYTLVCYNDSRESLCIASLSSSNEQGIQFELQAGMYASFRDNMGRRWSCMFLKASQLDSFLAAFGIAVYAMAGQPAHSTVISDFAPPAGEVRVGLQHRVKVRYSAFAIRKGEVLQLGELLETNGDRPYNFQPVQSAMALHREAKGFESSVLGMVEDSWRAVVVPATLPRSFGGCHLYGGDSVVFVLQVVRILHVDYAATEEEKVPCVFACDDHVGALVPAPTKTTDASGTQIVVLHSEQPGMATMSVATCGVGGSGVSAEHMSLVQKLGLQVNKAAVDARDVRDLAMSVAGEWKQSVNKPKLSLLTNAAVEQAVKQLIMENERITEDISHRDELLGAIDQRNRELQRRVDNAAIVSHQLMDEKNHSTRAASDLKLEKERVIMKLQEQINQAAHERDDIRRHLQTVKKLLEVSDEELRQVRGKADLHNIQAEAIVAKLGMTQDALAEERSRRKALDAKVIALQEEISNAGAELHLKTAQLEDICRMADIERAHHAQTMEDERQRRGYEAQQLRSEIVTELQMRDAKYQADRARVVEDNFKRGRAEGREVGRRATQVDVEAQLEELRLDAQRALTELDAFKTELRRVTEAGMAQNRTLGASVAELKRQMYEETRKRVVLEFQLCGLRAKVRSVPDSVMAVFTSLVYRLRRPVTAKDLLQLLNALKKREPFDFSFEEHNQAAEEAECTQRRLEWIESEMLSLYRDRCDAAYGKLSESLLAGWKLTAEAVHRLRLERDGVAFYHLDAAETRQRFEIVQQMETFFVDIKLFFEEQMAQRRRLISEAERVWVEATTEYAVMLDLLSARRLDELEERRRLSEEFITLHANCIAGETAVFEIFLKGLLMALAAAWQRGVIEAEESKRADIEADQFVEFSGIFFDHSKRWTDIFSVAAGTASVVAAEAQSRSVLLAEEERVVMNILEGNLPFPPPEATPLDDMENEVVGAEDGSISHHCFFSGAEGELAAAERTTLAALEPRVVDDGGSAFAESETDSYSYHTDPLSPPPPARNVVFPPARAAAKFRLFDDEDDSTEPAPSVGRVGVPKNISLPKSNRFDTSDSD